MQRIGRLAQLGSPLQLDRHAPAFHLHHADDFAFELDFQQRRDVVDRETETGCGITVDLRAQILDAVVGLRGGIGRAGDFFEGCQDRLGQTVQRGQIGAEYLDRHIAARPREHFRHAHVDRLREVDVDAREIIEHGTDLIDQPVLVGTTPLGHRFQHQKAVGLVQAHRIQTEFVRTRSRHDAADFRDGFQQRLLHPHVLRRRGIQIDRRQFFQLHQDIALVHRRHEGLADEGVGRHRAGHQHAGDGVRQLGAGERAIEQRRVERERAAKQPGIVVRGLLEQEGREHRDNGERQQQRGEQRKHDGQRHRREQLAFQPFKRKQRQKHDGNDDDARHHRRRDFLHCPQHTLDRFDFGLA